MKPRRPAPQPLTAAVWRELVKRHAPRVRGVIVNGRPHIIFTEAQGGKYESN